MPVFGGFPEVYGNITNTRASEICLEFKMAVEWLMRVYDSYENISLKEYHFTTKNRVYHS